MNDGLNPEGGARKIFYFPGIFKFSSNASEFAVSKLY